MNPDASLQQFLEKDFSALRKLCSHVTLYGDNTDGALFWSETFNREKALGKHPFALVKQKETSPLTEEPSAKLGVSKTRSTHFIQRASLHIAGLKSSKLATSKTLSGGSDLPTTADITRVVPLDMDVIDTSWMDANVHAMRHNIFNVNRWVVDDLREIVYTQKRARFRNTRLIRRSGNVFTFLSAPKHIVNP